MTEPQINTKDIVLRLDTKVDKLISDIADVKVIAATVGTTVEALHDHEMRIRALERFRFAIPSAAVILALAAVGDLVYALTR